MKYLKRRGVMNMKYAKMGLCEGRHQMPVEEYIFPQVVENPFDFSELEKVVHEKLKDVKELDLYVSGLTPVLIVAVNYCVFNGIETTLYHFDINSGEYVPQKLIIRREK
jgi:hypothetical protein